MIRIWSYWVPMPTKAKLGVLSKTVSQPSAYLEKLIISAAIRQILLKI
jgi:predicted DNA-binding protein